MLFTAVCLQGTVLIAMIALHALPYLVGEKVVLKVVPVDPRDYFRGDYVVLSYEANRPPPEGIEGIPQVGYWWSRRWDRDAYLEDRTVYVTIEPEADGRHWHAVKYSTERPKSGKFLRGNYSRNNFQNPIQFGIEAYYVEEGKGKGPGGSCETPRISRQKSPSPPGARPSSSSSLRSDPSIPFPISTSKSHNASPPSKSLKSTLSTHSSNQRNSQTTSLSRHKSRPAPKLSLDPSTTKRPANLLSHSPQESASSR